VVFHFFAMKKWASSSPHFSLQLRVSGVALDGQFCRCKISLHVLQINSIEWRTLEPGLTNSFGSPRRIAAHLRIGKKSDRPDEVIFLAVKSIISI
jgi:hypothetical protein